MSCLWRLLAIGLIGLAACSPIRQQALAKRIKTAEDRFQCHTGFMLYDPVLGKTIVDYNASRYFTPASNTKIFTLFACLNLLKDSIPSLKFVQGNDSLVFWGMGDPSFLNKNVFNNFRTYEFLKNTGARLYFAPSNFYTAQFGPGWAWDDYNSSFSAERSPFPVYGNVFSLYKIGGKLIAKPDFFQPGISIGDSASADSKIVRSLMSNNVTYHPGIYEKVTHWDRPFRADTFLLKRLLTDTLKRAVDIVNVQPLTAARILYSTPVDSAYKVMMQESDNFLAEQLLMVCAGLISDSLKPEITIKFMQDNYLNDLPDKAIWVDGSGLSRYNLFTPRSIVKLWDKIYRQVPQQRLFKILAVGGKSGTIRNYYKGERPYIYGKTGTLSNVHCLSGYLITKSDKLLIFSFMNNSFTVPARDIRNEMEGLLHLIYKKY